MSKASLDANLLHIALVAAIYYWHLLDPVARNV